MAAAAITVAVAVFVVVALLPGSGGDGPVPRGAVAQAAQNTAKVAGLRFVERGTFDDPTIGRADYTGEGVLDMRGRRVRIEGDYTELYDATRKAAGDAADELPPREQWRMTAVFDDTAMYMKFPAVLDPFLERGKTWARVDLESTAEAVGVDDSLVEVGVGSSDPSQMLRFLQAASDDVERLGTERIRGVHTVHYRATIDLRKYPELVPEDERRDARRSVDTLVKRYGTDEIETEVWIDGDMLVRRMKSREFNDLDGSNMAISSVQEFYDHGKPVTIETPPPGEVEDITERLERAARRARLGE